MNKIYLLILFWLGIFTSCKKSEYLNAKSDDALVIPQSLADFQAILDNDRYMNGNNLSGLVPDLEEVGTDDYFALPTITGLGTGFVNLYIWNDDIHSRTVNSWPFAYRCIVYANTVLDGVPKLKLSDAQKETYNNLIGSALFYRAHAFYHLSQVYAPVYDPATASNDWGIPLRVTSDVNEKISRATLIQTYDKIVDDLKQAIFLLPNTVPFKTRPSKQAGYALLARVYLSMRDYDNSLLYSDSSLQISNALIDYKTVTGSSTANLFDKFNSEVIFHSLIITNTNFGTSVGRVDSTLYSSYNTNDLRKSLYYRSQSNGYFSFRGSYDKSSSLFGGLANDEMFLIRAESYARKGNTNAALQDLNELMIKRWKNNGTWVPFTASDANDALNKILIERRKELVFRATRWTDLRRLNKEGANIAIKRIVDNQTYNLFPNSLYYTYLIPPDVIGFNPSMPQNVR